MPPLRSIAFAASSLLALLIAGCAGNVVDPGGTTGTGNTSTGNTSTGNTSTGNTGTGTTGTGTGTPFASPLYGVSAGASGALTVSRIDTNTGLTTQIAEIDGLSSWSRALFVDESATHAYTIGSSSEGALVSTTDLGTGAVTSVPLSNYGDLVAIPQPVGVTQEGLVVAVGQTNTTDFNAPIFLIDPTSGALTVFDHISLALDAGAELGSMIYDAPSRILYFVYEESGSSSWNLDRYSFEITSFLGTNSISSVPANAVMAGVLPDGKLAAVYRDNPQTAFLSTAEIDPVTGGVTVVQHVSGPSLWPNDATVYDGKVWFDTGNANLLFGLDPATGNGTQVGLSDMFVLAHY